MGLKKVLIGTASALLIGTVCALGAYPAADVYAADEIAIDETNFPDKNFRQYVLDVIDKDGSKSLSSKEISSTLAVDVHYKHISSLKGIEYFTELLELRCYNNLLTSLDISQNTKLHLLDCANNYIQKKSDIKGLNESSLRYCDYNPQYYEGYYNDLTYIDFKFTTVITGDTLQWSGYGGNLGGDAPGEDIVSRSEGINFFWISNPFIFSCDSPYVEITSTGNSNLLVDNIKITKAGEYTIAITVEHHDGSYYNVGSVKITAIDRQDHTEHEFIKYSPVNWENGKYQGHAKQCFCGEQLETEPHEYEVGLYADSDGKWEYSAFCSICSNFANLKEVLIITDDESGVTLAGLDDGKFDPDLTLDVSRKEDTSDIAIEGEKPVAVYDITLKKDGVTTEADGSLRITIPVPDGVKGTSAKIYRKEKDGTYTEMKTVYDSKTKTLSFVTDHLSIYVVTEVKESSGKSGDINNDGDFDIDDVIDLARSILTVKEGEENPYMPQGDRDGSGKIDIDDVILLARELIM